MIRLTHCPVDSDPAVYLIIHHQQRKPQHVGLAYRKDKDKQIVRVQNRDTHSGVRIVTLRLSLRRTTEQKLREVCCCLTVANLAAQPRRSPLLSGSKQHPIN